MRRRLSASALQMVRRSAMNFSTTGNRVLDINVSLIVQATGLPREPAQPLEPLFVQRFAFDRAAAKQARFVLGEVGPGMDGATVVPHQKVAQLPDMLVDEL